MTAPAPKVEFAFGSTMFSTSLSWTDVSSYVRQATFTRGRPSVDGRFQTGTGTLVLDNRDGRFNPENTQGAYSPDVKVGVPVRVTRTVVHSTSESFAVFYGSVRAWPPDYPRSGDSTVTVPVADGFYTLNLEDLSGQSYSEQTTAQRINAVLDDVGWPSSLRDIDTPLANVQATSFASPSDGGEQPALTHLLDVAEAEAGVLFMSADGKVTFKNRLHTSGVSPTVTFTDTSMSALSTAYNDDYLWNVIQVAREDGVQITVDESGAAPKRTLTRDVMPMSNDSEALNVAEWLSQLFGTQRLRIEHLSVKPLFNTSLFAAVLGLELRDVVGVEHTPPQGDSIDQDSAVEMIRHRIVPGDWEISFQVAPLATVESQAYWVLGTSELGTGTRLA